MQKLISKIIGMSRTNLIFITIIVWVTAITSVYLSGISVKNIINTKKQENEIQSIISSFPTITVNKRYDTSIYPSIQKRFEQMYRGKAIIAVTDDMLEIKVNNIEDYPIFKELLTDIQNSNPNIKWEIVSMCVGRKCGAPACRILLKGYTLEINVNKI